MTMLRTNDATAMTGVRVLEENPWDDHQTWRKAVRELEDPQVGLVLIPRAPLIGIQAVVGALPIQCVRTSITAVSASPVVAQACRRLDLWFEPLIDDIRQIASRFIMHTQVERANLRLDLIGEQLCPKFHCDNVVLRLLCTYNGPTTQYRGVQESDPVHHFPLASIGLLKGGRHAGFDGPRILHRSPPLKPGERRLTLVLDI